MAKIHVQRDQMRVCCPARHYLGSTINLVNTRPVYCEVCGNWYEWTEVEIGRKPRQEEKTENNLDE